jgi:carboxynorspermidine decarboxylase
MIKHPLLHNLEEVPSPSFVMVKKRLRSNLKLLQKIQQEAGIEILCALKGFAMWSVFPMMRQYLAGATASSLHEAMLCHETLETKAHLCAPIYPEHEFDSITGISSHITFNSIAQYEKFGGRAADKGLKIALRINPEYSEVSTDLYNPCVPGSRLGIVKDQMPAVLPQEVSGLHFHSLCGQNEDALIRTLQSVKINFGSYLHQIQWLNIGGGHHFTKDGYDLDRFIQYIRSFREQYQLDIIAEPGEAIGWQTGYLVSSIHDIVSNNGISTAMLDVSFAAHMPDCLEMPYMPYVFGSCDVQDANYCYRLGGNTCLAGDFAGPYGFEQQLRVGERIIFDDMMHYTMVKTNTFNGVQLPSIGIVEENGGFRLINSYGYNDYKNRLS